MRAGIFRDAKLNKVAYCVEMTLTQETVNRITTFSVIPQFKVLMSRNKAKPHTPSEANLLVF